MTFEGLDAGIRIETGGFMPAVAGDLPAAAPGEPTLDAALHQASLGGRAEIDAHDLWADRAHIFDRSGIAALSGPGRHGLGAGLDHFFAPDSHDPAGGKTSTLRAAIDADGDGNEDPEIVVTGWRPRTALPGFNGGDGPTGGGGTLGGAGGTGTSAPTQITEDADDTPCVNELPADTDLDHLNDLAKGIATKLGQLQDRDGWEYGSLIFRAPDGQLYQSEPFTARHRDDVNGAQIHIPNGSVIVGYVHTHPIDSTLDQRTLSDVDRDFINLLLARTGNVTADSNMLAYVTTKDKDFGNSDTYSTFVYDKSRRTASTPGCDL